MKKTKNAKRSGRNPLGRPRRGSVAREAVFSKCTSHMEKIWITKSSILYNLV
jgi:hypothetical protein